MDILVEIIGEIVMEVIGAGWVKLMMLPFPKDRISPKNYFRIKTAVCIFGILGIISLIVGITAVLSRDFLPVTAGVCLIAVPAGISIVQILVGIAVRLIRK